MSVAGGVHLANCHHGVGRRRRLFRRPAGQGRRRRSFRGARLASRRHARARARGRGRAGSNPPAQGQRHRRSQDHRPGRHGDVLRQAVGHRGRGAPAHADHEARHRRDLVPERRHQGRHAASDPRRQGAARRRRLCGDRDRPARRDRAARPAAAAGVRRIRRPPLGTRRDLPRGLQARRHQRRAQRRRPPLAVGEIRRAGRHVGRHHRHAPDHRADPLEPADPRIPARSRPRGGGGRPRPRRQAAGGLRRAAHSVLRPVAARDDHLDAPRPQRRQAARGALARRQRGRSRRTSGRADADEPRGARHPAAARRGPARRCERIERHGERAAAHGPCHPRRRRRGADDLRARHQSRHHHQGAAAADRPRDRGRRHRPLVSLVLFHGRDAGDRQHPRGGRARARRATASRRSTCGPSSRSASR